MLYPSLLFMLFNFSFGVRLRGAVFLAGSKFVQKCLAWAAQPIISITGTGESCLGLRLACWVQLDDAVSSLSAGKVRTNKKCGKWHIWNNTEVDKSASFRSAFLCLKLFFRTLLVLIVSKQTELKNCSWIWMVQENWFIFLLQERFYRKLLIALGKLKEPPLLMLQE